MAELIATCENETNTMNVRCSSNYRTSIGRSTPGFTPAGAKSIRRAVFRFWVDVDTRNKRLKVPRRTIKGRDAFPYGVLNQNNQQRPQ